MSQDLVNRLVSQVEKTLHGPAREQILGQLEQNPTADAVAEITYQIVTGLEGQAEQGGAPVELDILMGVATETIDMLVEIMEAMGIKLNPEEMGEESLMKMVLLHMKAVEGDPEQKAAAQELLASLAEDGTVDETMAHINGKASASPEEMQAAGAQMGAPQRKPVAAAVQQGLME